MHIRVSGRVGVIPARAQCTFPMDLTAPVFCSNTMAAMTKHYCFKNLKYNMAGMTPTLPLTRMCMPYPTLLMSPIDFTNVTVCSYVMAQRRLYARRPIGATAMAFCQVMCDCGLLRIDVSDGLPVELMDFSVDDDDDDGGGDEDREPDEG